MKPIPGPKLKLTVTKGPSSGSEFEFPPKVKVYVGRLVRGNKVSIKDPGISSKHLLIKFDIHSGNWDITDLDSSNGTTVTSKQLTPYVGYDIQDNDEIRLGESTVIKVNVDGEGGTKRGTGVEFPVIEEDRGLEVGFGEGNEEIGESVGRGLKGTRRALGGELGLVEEEGGKENEESEENGGKVKRVARRGAGGNLGVVEDGGKENEESEGNGGQAKRVLRRRVGGKVGVVEEDWGLEVGFGKENEESGGNVVKPKRVTRGRAGTRGGKLGVIEEDGGLEVGFDVENAGIRENEKQIGRGRGRGRDRGRGRVQRNDDDEKRLDDLGENAEKDVGVVSTGIRRETRNSSRKGGHGGKDGDLRFAFDEELRGNEKKMSRGAVHRNENSEIGKEGERLEDLAGNEMKDVGVVSTGLGRVTRSSRRKENDVTNNGEKVGDTGIGRVTRGGRVTRSSRIEKMSEIKVDDAATGKDREKGPAKSRKKIRSTSVENCGVGENGVEGGLVENLVAVDLRSKRNRTTVTKKLTLQSLENIQINEEEMGEKSNLGEEGGYGEVEKNQEGDRVEIAQEKGCDVGLASAVLKSSGGLNSEQIREEEMAEKSKWGEEGDCGEVEKNGKEDRVESMQNKVCGDGLPSSSPMHVSVLDRLEKMTLGQWLDYIEEYLPKQIVTETEEMIMEMRLKAERFHEFMLQQDAAKEGVDI